MQTNPMTIRLTQPTTSLNLMIWQVTHAGR